MFAATLSPCHHWLWLHLPFLLTHSDAANCQLQNVSGRSSSGTRRTLAKYKIQETNKKKCFLKKQLEAAANRMLYCFAGTNKVQPACSLFIIRSVRLQTLGTKSKFHERSTLSDCLGL